MPSSERVYRRMKEMIISGELPPHTRLVELQFAAEFGVSRTPVREALKRLTADKLVHTDPVRGLIVHDPEPHEIQDIYLVREVLEGLATRLAAQRIAPEELQRLRAILDSMHEGLEDGRTDIVVSANLAFHEVIYRAAGNATLSRLARDLSDFVRRFSTEAFSSGPRVNTVFDEHEAILKALEKRDPDEAERASARHLRAASEYMTQLHVRNAIGRHPVSAAS
ncbi:MAG: GntR family transcriptional regulator [Candidatus Limnocylindrales bacterium]